MMSNENPSCSNTAKIDRPPGLPSDSILQSLSAAVIVCDVSGHIHYLNASARRLLANRQIPLRSWFLYDLLELIDETTGQRVVNPILKCLRKSGNNGRVLGHAILHRELDDATIGVTANLVRNPQRQIIGIAFELHQFHL